MVMPLVESLDPNRPTCFARTWLFMADDSLRGGELIKAGCELREAVRVMLEALCEAHDCIPVKNGRQSPRVMLKVLKSVGQCSEFASAVIIEAIVIGNKLAHCQRVPPGEIALALQLIHALLDGCSELNLPDFGKKGARS